MRGTILALARHIAAVVVAWLATQLPLTPEQAADVEGGLTALGVALMLIVYAAAEKLLKPLFFRLLGEIQPGEVPPQAHDAAVARERP